MGWHCSTPYEEDRQLHLVEVSSTRERLLPCSRDAEYNCQNVLILVGYQYTSTNCNVDHKAAAAAAAAVAAAVNNRSSIRTAAALALLHV